MSHQSLQNPEQAESIQSLTATTSRLATKDYSPTFLSLPREIRDEIYRFLLSTKYTKHVLHEAEAVGSTCLFNDSVKYHLTAYVGFDEERAYLSIQYFNPFR